jgi:hypothetical protein
VNVRFIAWKEAGKARILSESTLPLIIQEQDKIFGDVSRCWKPDFVRTLLGTFLHYIEASLLHKPRWNEKASL